MGQGAISPSLMVLFLQEVRKGCGCPNERLFTVLVSALARERSTLNKSHKISWEQTLAH